MRVVVLRLATPQLLASAMSRLMESEHVVDCCVEAELGRIRFLAPPRRAEALVGRIYLDGGLVWCSRHDLASSDAATLREVAPPAGPTR